MSIKSLRASALKHRNYLLLGTDSDSLVSYLTALEYDERGDIADLKSACKLLLVVNVDLTNEEFGMLVCDLVHNRRYHAARTAPICIEIKQHGLFARRCLFKIIFCYLYY